MVRSIGGVGREQCTFRRTFCLNFMKNLYKSCLSWINKQDKLKNIRNVMNLGCLLQCHVQSLNTEIDERYFIQTEIKIDIY